MISAILAIVSNVISLATFSLYDFLFVSLGFSVIIVTNIYIIVNLLIVSLNVISTVILLLAIYKLYKTHNNNGIEQKFN